jgi:hypothetical protein
VAEPRDRSQLVGDFLRECAVLMFVLYPLEAALQGKFDWWVYVIVLAVSVIMLYFGANLEGPDRW